MDHGKGLKPLAIASTVLLITGFALAAFYAPNDADQGFIQKIFYLHVPMAIVALIAFTSAGVMAVQYLRTEDPKWDLRSYVTIHIALVLAMAVLITGAIWAKASWGHWWVWDEPMLVSFLIVFLLYMTYQPLRFSIEDKEKQSRYASVFAIVAGSFVPLNFAAVRMAESFTHPRTLGTTTGGMPGKMMLVFLVCLVAMALVTYTLIRFEIAAKHTRFRIRAAKRRLQGDDEFIPVGRSAVPTL